MISILSVILSLFINRAPADEIPFKPEPTKIACGHNSDTVEKLIGRPDQVYQCYEIGAMRYGTKLYAFYNGELYGELPMYSYFDKCIDHRSVTGFKSLCTQ